MQQFFDKYAFGVCNRLGEYLMIPTSSIRLFFIYSSFLTFGSPLIVYLSLAFIIQFRRWFRRRENILWYY